MGNHCLFFWMNCNDATVTSLQRWFVRGIISWIAWLKPFLGYWIMMIQPEICPGLCICVVDIQWAENVIYNLVGMIFWFMLGVGTWGIAEYIQIAIMVGSMMSVHPSKLTVCYWKWPMQNVDFPLRRKRLQENISYIHLIFILQSSAINH